MVHAVYHKFDFTRIIAEDRPQSNVLNNTEHLLSKVQLLGGQT